MEAYKNWRSKGYTFSRKPTLFEPVTTHFVQPYKYLHNSEKLPPEAESRMLKVLESELEEVNQAAFRPIKVLENQLDLCFLFFRVDTGVYLACIYAYPSVKPEDNKQSIMSFFNTLAIQLKFLTTVNLDRNK